MAMSRFIPSCQAAVDRQGRARTCQGWEKSTWADLQAGTSTIDQRLGHAVAGVNS